MFLLEAQNTIHWNASKKKKAQEPRDELFENQPLLTHSPCVHTPSEHPGLTLCSSKRSSKVKFFCSMCHTETLFATMTVETNSRHQCGSSLSVPADHSRDPGRPSGQVVKASILHPCWRADRGSTSLGRRQTWQGCPTTDRAQS